MYPFFIIVILTIPVLCLTYKAKSKWLLWPLLIVPPLLLTPLAVIPINNPIVLVLWLPVLPFLLVSVITLLTRTLGLAKSKNCSDPLYRIRLIRPFLTVFMFVLIFSNHHISKNMANEFAIGLAKECQLVCVSSGICPDTPPEKYKEDGFNGGADAYSTTIRKLGISYPVHYFPSHDRKTFRVFVKHGFNMATHVEGGVNKELKASYWDEELEYEIPVN